MNYVIRLPSFYKLVLRTPLKEILNDLICKQVHYVQHAYLFGGQHLTLKRLRAMWALAGHISHWRLRVLVKSHDLTIVLL